MTNFAWTLALISVGIVTPVVQHVGYFKDEKDCQEAESNLKKQDLGLKLKVICLQIKAIPDPPTPPPVATVKPPTPVETIGSSNAKSKK
jgi:hypothetical protein